MIHALMGTSLRVSKEPLIHMDWSTSTAIVEDTAIHVTIAVLQAMVEYPMSHVFITILPTMAEAAIPPVAIAIAVGTAAIHAATALLLVLISHATRTADATAADPFLVTLTDPLPNRPTLQDVAAAALTVTTIVALIKSLLSAPTHPRPS